MTSSNIHIMGFKPPQQYDDALHQLFLAAQIKEDAGLEIECGSVHYIIGNVWNTFTHDFDPGPAANVIINTNITQDDINDINTAHRTAHTSSLIFSLGHKYKSDYNTNNWYRNDIANTIAFDRFTIPDSLTNTQKVNGTPIKCIKNTSPHPHNNNSFTKSGEVLGAETLYGPSQAQEIPHCIPPSTGHTCTPRAHKSHRRKFKCNVLTDLNKQIQQNITYNQNINDASNAPLTPLTPHRHQLAPMRTIPNDNNNADNTALNAKINININEPQKNDYAIVRALTHYNSIKLGIFNSEVAPRKSPPTSRPFKDIIFNSLGSLPSIKQSLTCNGYVLNDENKTRFTFFFSSIPFFVIFCVIFLCYVSAHH